MTFRWPLLSHRAGAPYLMVSPLCVFLTFDKIDCLGRSHFFLGDWSADSISFLTPLTPHSLSFPPLQLHNEDDSSEASTSEQQPQPCTSAAAAAQASSQDHSQAQAGPSPASAQRDVEVPPPPYASIDLGATAAAAPGVWKTSVVCQAAGSFSVKSMANSPPAGI